MSNTKLTKERLQKYDDQNLTEKQISMRTGLTRPAIFTARKRYGMERKKG